MTNYRVRRCEDILVWRQRYTIAESKCFIYNSCEFYFIIQEPFYVVLVSEIVSFLLHVIKVTVYQFYCLHRLTFLH